MEILAAKLELYDADRYTPENIKETIDWLNGIKEGLLK